jgi:hypothetical protein
LRSDSGKADPVLGHPSVKVGKIEDIVAKAVKDGMSLVELEAAEHVLVMPENEVSARIAVNGLSRSMNRSPTANMETGTSGAPCLTT